MTHDTQNEAPLLRRKLSEQIALIVETCIECPQCSSQCAFLKEHGNPRQIASGWDPGRMESLTLPFLCNLCDLCGSVCPVNLNPGAMFLEMRRESAARGVSPRPEHRGMIAYERRGTSSRYSWYSLPEGCRTVFFPGCTFAGTRSDTTLALYERIRSDIPDLGIVLDCCTKPSHDLGRDGFFHAMFDEMKNWLTGQGVTSVMVVCPNCYKVFNHYGSPLTVTTVYGFLAEKGMTDPGRETLKTVTIHDPCVLRHEPKIQDAVRQLASLGHFRVEEMTHSKANTVCCGEGGTVGALSAKFPEAWQTIRREEARGLLILTSCAGCVGQLKKMTPTEHILDALFHPEAVTEGKRKVTGAPLTYVKRMLLKRHLRKAHPDHVTRERTFQAETGPVSSTASALMKLLVLGLVAAAIAGIHASGLLRHVEPETLRQAVASWGALAPMVYLLIYAVAPALFLPGMPLTLLGGVLFGPFWGVVYSITGATTGAGVAFLVSRYLARDWIKARLTGPRWQKLDEGVEKNGWKIVAFTRLVPLFPFNLLNYAFGLTSIRFLPYVLTSFICMLPVCIAFIVFSSSLLDLMKGKVSPTLIIGVLLIAAVSLIPVLVRWLRKKEVDELE